MSSMRVNNWCVSGVFAGLVLLSTSASAFYSNENHQQGLLPTGNNTVEPYVSAFGGYSLASEEEGLRLTPTPSAGTFAASNFDLDTDGAGIYGGAFGLRYNHFRIEAALSYSDHDTTLKNSSVLSNFSGSEVSALTLMANMYYDIPVSRRVSLFVGAGAGYAWVDYDILYNAAGVTPSNGRFLKASADLDSFAYQGILGLSVTLTNAVKMSFSYRYLGVLEDTVSAGTDATAGVGSFTQRISDLGYSSNNFLLGLSYYF